MVLTTEPMPVAPGDTVNFSTLPSLRGNSTEIEAEPVAYLTLRPVLLSYKGLDCMAAAILAAANAGVYSSPEITTLTPPTVTVPVMGVPLKVID